MRNITFNKLSNTAGMFGNSQIGVYENGILKFYLATSEIYDCGIRVFSVPDDIQLVDFMLSHRTDSFEEMIKIIMENYDELLNSYKNTERFIIKAILGNGLELYLSSETLLHGNIHFVSNEGGMVGTHALKVVTSLIERYKNGSKPFNNDVVTIYTVSLRTFEKTVIYS